MLGKPQGVFDLNDSNLAVGSFIKRSDASEIFQVRDDAFRDLSWREISGVWVIDERELHKAWYDHRIHGAAPPGGGKVGVDELVIECLLRRSFPRCIVTRQVRVQRFWMDLKVESGDETVYIEFDGPHHFTVSRYGQPHDPRIKKKKVEDQTGIEVVNWPFWINRCESNVRALFDRHVRGYGAIWSAGQGALFGNFIFDDAADLIEQFTCRFNAVGGDGYGYFYGPNTRGRCNPEHPIIKKIRDGKAPRSLLLPRGYKDETRWLPPARG
ncbi:MAG: hypothetical protein WCT12_01900 [Verrucomicrobiota bacterium]